MLSCLLKRAMLPAILLSCAAIVSAQDDHGHSDVEFLYEGGMIAVEAGPEGRVFEGQFALEGVERLFTTEPGFASELAEGMGIGAGDQIVYNVLGPLVYWNDGFKPLPGDVQVRIANSPPAPAVPDTRVSSTSGIQLGSFVPPTNRIGEADAAGDFHSDLEFYFESANTPVVVPESWYGAYGIQLSLSSDEPGIANSDPFFVVFNLGLGEEAFEAGVADYAAMVPEPLGTSWLVGALLFGFARRTRGR